MSLFEQPTTLFLGLPVGVEVERYDGEVLPNESLMQSYLRHESDRADKEVSDTLRAITGSRPYAGR